MRSVEFLFEYLERVFKNVYYLFAAALDEDRAGKNEKGESLSQKQRHQMKHRELFLSRQVETLPATHIRGKCSVTLLNETESLLSYLNKDVSCTIDWLIEVFSA